MRLLGGLQPKHLFGEKEIKNLALLQIWLYVYVICLMAKKWGGRWGGRYPLGEIMWYKFFTPGQNLMWKTSKWEREREREKQPRVVQCFLLTNIFTWIMVLSSSVSCGDQAGQQSFPSGWANWTPESSMICPGPGCVSGRHRTSTLAFWGQITDFVTTELLSLSDW